MPESGSNSHKEFSLMRILILHDGRAGHRNQSRAIAMALRRNFDVTETQVHCKLRIGIFQKPLRFLLNLTGGNIPFVLFRVFHTGGELPSGRPDLIISAGGGTTHANAWLAGHYHCPNLFCGDLRGFKTSLFKAVVTAYGKYQGISPYLISPTPVPIDQTDLAIAEKNFRERSSIADTTCWSLLVGGSGAGYHYTENDWLTLAEGMRKLAEIHQIKWLITTSRRSGKAAEDALSKVIDSKFVAAAHYAGRATGDVSYQEIIGTAVRHFCTEDSHMMISEAIASGRPVHTLQPANFNTHQTNQHFLDLYCDKGWIMRHSIRDMAFIKFPLIETPSANHPSVMDDLSLLLKKWWGSLDTEQTSSNSTRL